MVKNVRLWQWSYVTVKFLASKIHSNFRSKTKITKKIAVLLIAPPYTSLDLAQNLSSDQLWGTSTLVRDGKQTQIISMSFAS